MRITFLGTGDAGGVPRYGCDCSACTRARVDSTFRRRSASVLVEAEGTRVLIDAGLTDLTERFPPGSLTAIVLTHFHPDHVQGLFHLRWGVGASIPVYAPPDTAGCADLYKHSGLLDFRHLSKFQPVMISDVRLTPLPLIHSKPTFGYAIEDAAGHRFAYLTDTVGLPPRTEQFLLEHRVADLAIDCSHPPMPEPRNHNDWTLALALIERIAPQRAYLTHISHTLDAWLDARGTCLPPTARIARDGLVIQGTG